jgi:hypothetical protein
MTTGVSAAVKALKYAEVDLGVHAVYTECLGKRELLDETLNLLGTARDTKRSIEAQLQDIEMETIIEERGKHPEMSQAQMDKHIKASMYSNPQARILREDHAKLINDIDGLEMDKTMSETDIRIAVARLTELGGYFQYLAAVKQAAFTNTPSETSTS